eukprot:6214095-Pleurochrysis_carterae.AAC.3
MALSKTRIPICEQQPRLDCRSIICAPLSILPRAEVHRFESSCTRVHYFHKEFVLLTSCCTHARNTYARM